MKIAETFYMDLVEFVKPMEGRLVDVTLEGGETVKARVMSIDPSTVELKVVPATTKE